MKERKKEEKKKSIQFLHHSAITRQPPTHAQQHQFGPEEGDPGVVGAAVCWAY